MSKKSNKFQWEMQIREAQSLNDLYSILSYHVLHNKEALQEMVLKITFDEETAGKIHEEIREYVSDHDLVAKLKIISDGEEPIRFSYPGGMIEE